MIGYIEDVENECYFAQRRDHPHPPPPHLPATAAPSPKESAQQSLSAIIQLHFEKTLEKKYAVDLQKKQLWRFFLLFFIFLALFLSALSQSSRLRCRHFWAPIGLLSLAHLVFYVSVAQTLRCINGFKYQRRCHKLTLGVATEKLRRLQRVAGRGAGEDVRLDEEDEEEMATVRYQEPPESYMAKFKRNWALYFGLLVFTYCFMVSATVSILCF
ncbi:hypothetical protein EJ110_NYTH34228 [Nymphaea thermarum]|nr:hypothetical protein EJ110_NYTH34228 [Nymphaea thermarum]